eukprot:425287_1
MTILQLQIIMKEYINIASIESVLNDDQIKQKFSQKNKSDYVNEIIELEMNLEWAQFEMWLKENKLKKLIPTFKENKQNEESVSSLSHLTDVLKNESDIDEFVKNQLEDNIWATKFKNVVLKTLIGKMDKTQSNNN